jgi:hypothetical protein
MAAQLLLGTAQPLHLKLAVPLIPLQDCLAAAGVRLLQLSLLLLLLMSMRLACPVEL